MLHVSDPPPNPYCYAPAILLLLYKDSEEMSPPPSTKGPSLQTLSLSVFVFSTPTCAWSAVCSFGDPSAYAAQTHKDSVQIPIYIFISLSTSSMVMCLSKKPNTKREDTVRTSLVFCKHSSSCICMGCRYVTINHIIERAIWSAFPVPVGLLPMMKKL